MYLSFEESIFGAKRDVEVPYIQTCDNCGGTGAKSSSCLITCAECGGRGRTMKTEKTPFGVMSQVLNVMHFSEVNVCGCDCMWTSHDFFNLLTVRNHNSHSTDAEQLLHIAWKYLCIYELFNSLSD